MNLTFFFTHLKQDPEGAWITFMQAFSQHQGGQAGQTVSAVVSEDQPLSEIHFRVPEGYEPLQTNVSDFINASDDFISADFTNILIEDYDATIASPVKPSALRERLTRRLPSGLTLNTYEQTTETLYPRLVTDQEGFDVSYTTEFDASSGSHIKRYFRTPVTFDVAPEAVEALYGPAETWAEAEGTHILDLLPSNSYLQGIYDTNPNYLQLDASAAGHHYLLSADSDLFCTNTVELNIELDAYYSQIMDSGFSRCQQDQIARLYLAELPKAVEEFYGIFHTLTDLKGAVWYSDVWLRLFAWAGPLELFERPFPALDTPYSPAAFHEVRWDSLQREFTDVPPESVTHTGVRRLEGDQTAYGFADATYIRANSTKIHIGDIPPDSDPALITLFPVYASTGWLSADAWFTFGSTTSLDADTYQTNYRVDSWQRVVVEGYEPEDEAPPVLVPPPLDFFVLPPEPSLPVPLVTAATLITIDSDLVLAGQTDLETEAPLVAPELDVPAYWQRCQDLDASSTWVHVDASILGCDSNHLALEGYDDVGLADFLYQGEAFPNQIYLSADALSITADDASVLVNYEYFIAFSPSELETPSWERFYIIDASENILASNAWVTADALTLVLETWSTADLSHQTAVIERQAEEGYLITSADQFALAWDDLTADSWTLSLAVDNHPLDSSSGWVTADFTIRADQTQFLSWEPGEVEGPYWYGGGLIAQTWTIGSIECQELTASNACLQADSPVHVNDTHYDTIDSQTADVLLAPELYSAYVRTEAGLYLVRHPEPQTSGLPLAISVNTYSLLTSSPVTVDTTELEEQSALVYESSLTSPAYSNASSYWLNASHDFTADLTQFFEPTQQFETLEWHLYVGAASSWLDASAYVNTNFYFLSLETFEEPEVQLHPLRLFVEQEFSLLEANAEPAELPALPSVLMDGDTITFLASYSLITADTDVLLVNDEIAELVFTPYDTTEPSQPLSITVEEEPLPLLTPGGPYSGSFNLPPYPYPTFQTSYPVEADLDFLVNAGSFITADSHDLPLSGILPLVPYQLQTYFDLRADAFFSVDQDYITADAFEITFDLEELQIVPRPCDLLPDEEQVTADAQFFNRQRWLNPWWTGIAEQELLDWPYATEQLNSPTPLDIPRSEGQEVLKDRTIHLENVPYGRLLLEIPEHSLAYLPEAGRGFLPSSSLGDEMPGAYLHELAAGLLGLLSGNQTWVVLKTLDEILYTWAVTLNNVQEGIDGPSLNTAVTWGLPSFLSREGPYADERDVFEMAWLGFALTQTCHYFADRPDAHRVDLPVNLGLLLEQLAYLVANAIDPIQGWAIRGYDETGRLSGSTDYPTTVMATLFLSEYLSFSYDTDLHDRAAVAWTAIADGPIIPLPEVFGLDNQRSLGELATYKLLWASRFSQQLDVEALVEVALNQPDRDEVFLAVILQSLRFPLPANLAVGFDRGQLSWSTAGPSLWKTALTNVYAREFPLFVNPAFQLYAQEAWGHTAYAYQLQKWMWPYGYRWVSWQAEQPQGGTLGKFLYALAFLAFFWAIRYNMLRNSRSITSSQGWALDEWGTNLGLERRRYESDAHYREALLLWLNLERGTTWGLAQVLGERQELQYEIQETMLQLFQDGVEERQGVFEDGIYRPYVYKNNPWIGSADQVELLRQGGKVKSFSADQWDLDASQSDLATPESWARRDLIDPPTVTVPLTADFTELDERLGVPGFYRAARTTMHDADASETWLSADSAEVFWPFSQGSMTVDVLASGYSPRLLQELQSVMTLGYKPHLRLYRVGRQLPLLAVETEPPGREQFSILTGQVTTVLDLELQDLSPSPFVVTDLVLETELFEL